MKRYFTSTFIVFLICSDFAHAEVPLLSADELKSTASHIIVGKVRAVFSTTENNSNWEKTDLIAQIELMGVEKGTGVTGGDVIYAHYWNKKWTGKGDVPPHASGHSGVSKGDFVRAHLDRKNSTYHVILPNGLDKLEAEQAKATPANATANLQGTWNFVYYVEKGNVETPGTKQFAINENRLDFRAGGQTRIETTIEVKGQTLDQNFKDGQVYRSIFKRVGELLIICGNRDKDRPTEFAGGTDKGGDFLIVLKRE
ncbi:MAG: hypothetical protein P1V19_21840 [Gimesia sp.]|nr:hypothetical protein [Gimesia sp.]